MKTETKVNTKHTQFLQTQKQNKTAQNTQQSLFRFQTNNTHKQSAIMTRKATNKNTSTTTTKAMTTISAVARKSKAPCASEEERKERRRAANRRSAQKSRYREMVLMEELQKTVTDLSKRNSSLKDENDAFRRDLALLQNLMVGRKQPQQKAVVSSAVGACGTGESVS